MHAQIPASISGTLFRLHGKQITLKIRPGNFIAADLSPWGKKPENSDTYLKNVNTVFYAGCWKRE